MKKEKENALNDCIEMIKHSWTYEKLTATERENLMLSFNQHSVTEALKGNYNQRWNILRAIYHTYLLALGFNNNPTWREENINDIPLF